MNALLVVGIGVAVGLALGLLGAGGSILTVPTLVYGLGQSPQTAITTSLIIVGANSAMGTWFHHRQGTLRWKTALVFGLAGMAAAFPMSQVSKRLPGDVLMVAFAVVALVVGSLLLFNRQVDRREKPGPPNWILVLAAGAGVGLLTGLLGVGGGFLIVPALVLLLGLPTKQAIGTSLGVITLNCISGLAGHLGTPVDWPVIAVFATAGLGGSWLGTRLGRRLSAARLRQLFAAFVIAIGLALMADNLPRLFR